MDPALSSAVQGMNHVAGACAASLSRTDPGRVEAETQLMPTSNHGLDSCLTSLAIHSDIIKGERLMKMVMVSW